MPTNQTIAQTKYDAENTYRLKVPLSAQSDTDVIERLNSASNKGKYVKGLMAKDVGIPDTYSERITFDESTKDIGSTILSLKFNLKTETELIDRIKTVPSKVDYIRKLVRDDMTGKHTKSWSEISKKIDLAPAQASAAQTAKLLADIADQLKQEESCTDKRAIIEQLNDSIKTWLEITKRI